MTTKSNSFKNITTVLLALLLLGIAATPSATVFLVKSETISHKVVPLSSSSITIKENGELYGW